MNAQLMARAEQSFGGPVVSILLKYAGSVLGQMLLKWLMDRPAVAAEFKAQTEVPGVTQDALGGIVLQLLIRHVKENRDEILLFLKERTGELLDLLISHLESYPA